ncbi:MAG: hypothetical protein KDB03_14170 [Planctomycetales bacterium]|nr:hypothetical protein [Planctomycetales bacterium]
MHHRSTFNALRAILLTAALGLSGCENEKNTAADRNQIGTSPQASVGRHNQFADSPASGSDTAESVTNTSTALADGLSMLPDASQIAVETGVSNSQVAEPTTVRNMQEETPLEVPPPEIVQEFVQDSPDGIQDVDVPQTFIPSSSEQITQAPTDEPTNPLEFAEPTAQSEAGLLAADVPLPENSFELEMNSRIQMIIFHSQLPLSELATFYRDALGKLGWTEVQDETFLADKQNTGGITFAKDDESFRILIQDGQETSKSRVVIDGEGITWPAVEPELGEVIGEYVMDESDSESLDNSVALRITEVRLGTCKGFLQRNEEKYEMHHALAFESTEFDDKVWMIYVSQKPFRTHGIEGTRVEDLSILDCRDDNAPSAEIRIRESFVSINCFADSSSLSISGGDFKSELEVKDGRKLTGRAFSSSPHEFFDDTFQFSLTFDIPIMKTELTTPPERLAADEDYPYPVAVGSDGISLEGSPYRTFIRGTHATDIPTLANFYRTQLDASGWHEVAEQAKANETAANMVFDNDEEVIQVQLRRSQDVTEFALAARQEQQAQKDGIVPEAGQSRILLANATDKEIEVHIDASKQKITAGLGGNDPADAIKLNVKPGKHTVIIKVPGEQPQKQELECPAGTAWAIVAFGEEDYLADRIY